MEPCSRACELQLQSLCATTAEPCMLWGPWATTVEPASHIYWSLHNLKPYAATSEAHAP